MLISPQGNCSEKDLHGHWAPGGLGLWLLRNWSFVLKYWILLSHLFEISLSTNFTKNKSFSFGRWVMGWSYRTQSHTVSFNKVLACLSAKFLVAKYDWNVLFMLTGLRRCCKTAQNPGRCKQGITGWAVKIWREGINTHFCSFFLPFSFKKKVVLSEKERGKRVKCLKIYSFSELFPNPKQGTMMHTWWRQPKGNKNKFKIFSPDPTRPYKGIKNYGYGWTRIVFFLSPIQGFEPAQRANF